jgi:phosphate transport system substrate-binding protein
MLRSSFKAAHTALLAAICAFAPVLARPATAQAPASASTIRVWGHGHRGKDYIQTLLTAWQNGFRKTHSAAAFDDQLDGNASAIGGLFTGTADLAVMDREASFIELDACEQGAGHKLFGVPVALGSVALPHHAPALAVYVNPRNPLSQLSLQQLDGLFDADHRRGDRSYRTWGELGLTGKWATQPIHLYTYEIQSAEVQFFERVALKGSQKFNCNLTLFGATPHESAATRIRAAVLKDPDGVALLAGSAPGLKLVPLSDGSGAVSRATHRPASTANARACTQADTQIRQPHAQDRRAGRGGQLMRKLPGTLAAVTLLALVPPLPAQSTPPPTRIWGHGALGHDYIESLVRKWEAGYTQLHPETRFDNELHGTASAIGALYTGTGDIAIMGREIWPVEVEAFEDVLHREPLGVDVVTGSLDIRNKDFALVVFVNKQNPLAHLSLEQIASVFGAAHTPPTTWGELGLTGEWAKRPIHLYGFEIHRGFGYYLEQRVMNGNTLWNPSLVELGDLKQPDGKLLDAGQRIVDAIANDPDALGYSSLLCKNPGVRPVPIGPAGGPFLLATHQSIVDHSYALTRSITAFVDPGPTGHVDPRIADFLRYVFSPAGQQAVVEDGGYTALPPSLARKEAAKLSARP